MKKRRDQDGDFLLVTPGACLCCGDEENLLGQWAADPDNARFRRWYTNEFGYSPPRPLHFAAPLEAARKVSFEELDENNQILAACHEAVSPHLQQLRRDMLLRHENPATVFDLIDIRLKVVNFTSLPPADAAARDYCLGWRRLGNYRDEQRLEVGLASAQLTVFALNREIHMTWWERETEVVARAVLEEVFRRQCALLEGFASRHIPQIVAGMAEDWFGSAFSFVSEIYAKVKDCTAHLYQNPAWERFWIEVGKEGLSSAIRARNHHPGSGRWTRQDNRFVVPDPFRRGPMGK